jgi:hypothetical protein
MVDGLLFEGIPQATIIAVTETMRLDAVIAPADFV